MNNSDLLDQHIAVIGMAGRFPGARNIDEFWLNLRQGVESITIFSDEELADAGVAPELLKDPRYVKASAVLDDVELFDASFFGFTPREAEIMDPQHRFFLECAWEALEHAGHDPERGRDRIGVYAGSSANTYLLFNVYANAALVSSVGRYQTLIGSDKDFLPTRVSYKLNLKGPSVNVQTSCSTSLVAVHIACQSLLNGECDMALAGGVSINVPNRTGYLYQEGGILSPDGHCRAFDAKAQGTISGSGVGVVVLKRLREALADGDSIHAVIRGSAINNDGALKVGFTAPGLEGQAEVISVAMAMAEVEPQSITYVEAHGTGTALGDPVELAALDKAFGTGARRHPCAIGSVKTNIGHLDTAAGVAGLIKTILALKHGMLPPSLHYAVPNSQIDFAGNRFKVNAQLTDWQTNDGPRRAGVSSFGIGGTNAHLVLEEAPVAETSRHVRPWQILILSAQTETALQTATDNLILALKHDPAPNLADAAYTYQVGRRAFRHRRMLICREADDAARALETLSPQRVLTHAQEGTQRPVAFMFPGQGAQYANMGRELYKFEPSFRQLVDFSAEFLASRLGVDLRDLLFPDESEAAAATVRLSQTFITQPALFVIEYALARLWMEWGVRPEAMIGHSVGEYVAACLSGVFSLEDALSLVAFRGRLMQLTPEGAMLSVALSESEVRSLLSDELSLAAVNAPSRCVISGPLEALGQLQERLIKDGVGCQRLHTSHAFHSSLMEPVIGPFTGAVQKLTLRAPKIPFISNVTGNWITQAEATSPEYWVAHLHRPVLFSAGLRELTESSDRALLEVGPGRTLSTLARRHGKIGARVVLSSMIAPSGSASTESDAATSSDVSTDTSVSAEAFLLNTLGRLWLSGVEVDWTGFHAHERCRRIPLPTYPFERQRYWIAPARRNADDASTRHLSLRKNLDLSQWFYLPSWKRADLHRSSAQIERPSGTPCWIIFVDADGPGSQLVECLLKLDQNVFAVCLGERFARNSERTYSINPRQRADYNVLLEDIMARNMTPWRLVHSWSITSGQTLGNGEEFFTESQDKGFYSLLFLAQACAGLNLSGPLQLCVISNHLQEVLGEDLLSPEKAPVLGLCKVIPQEYPNITCHNIDIIVPEAGTIHETKLLNQLLAELTSPQPDATVAYRGGHRWVQTFESMRVDQVDQPTSLRGLRERGVYLITGGLGNIGLALAGHLARRVRARLVLAGRTTLPLRGEWERWLAIHDEQDEMSATIRKVQAMEAFGAEVEIAGADVADEQQMREAVNLAHRRFGILHGIIHSAGVDRERAMRPIQELNRAECEEQFRTKARALFVLERVMQNERLDFCLLQSSLSSILGGLGFAAYSAANIFMDVFAHRHNQTGSTPWTSVNWDGWQFKEAGERKAVAPTSLTELALTPSEGTEVFQRILSLLPATRVIVSTADLQARIERWLTPTTFQDQERQRDDNPLPLHQRPLLATEYHAPRNDVERGLADIWQELLGVERVGIYDNFFELGGDSLVAVRLISRLRLTFQREVPVHVFFDAPTIASLAESISEASAQGLEDDEKISELLEMMDQLSEEEVLTLIEGRKNSAKGGTRHE